MMRRVRVLLVMLLTLAALSACGTTKPHARHRSGCGPASLHQDGCVARSTPAARIGAPTPGGVVCSQRLNAGANVQSAVSSAAAGSVVCLNSGSWSAISLSGIVPAAPGVTLAATPGQSVIVPGFTVTGANTQNLTIEGFSITAPGNTRNPQDGNPNNGIQLLCGIAGGVTFAYNTIENQPRGDAIYAYAGNCGGGRTQSGVTFEYNQIDHVENALQVDGGIAEESNFVFSHNVVGPDIQDGGYGHYIQVQGIAGLTVNNNAFEGPPDPAYENCAADGSASHLNVLHVDTGQTNVTFDNNILWHVQTCGQSVLIQNTPMDNIAVNNNLNVDDPACNTNASNSCQAQFALVEAPHGLTFEHNTVVNAARGITLGYVAGGAEATYTNPENMTAQDNIAAPTSGEAGGSNYSTWRCTSSCDAQSNVSADSTANSVFGGGGNVIRWAPRWMTTSWTPVAGAGYQPPPSGYYQPTGLAISGAGYQGQVGP